MARKINNIVIHCTATQPNATVSAIQNYWKNTLGWKSPGYHRIIDRNGKITKLASFDNVTNGVANHNSDSIHISYIGGIDGAGKAKDTRTDEQKISILHCIGEALRYAPTAKIVGHRDFAGVVKECPSFDAKKEYSDI